MTTQIPDGYVQDAKGRLVPETMVKGQHRLEDQTVRHIIKYARDLNEQIKRFYGHTLDDLYAFMDTLAEEYDAKKGGAKGNATFATYDGLLKITIQVQDTLTFGPELQVAKGLFDECIAKWSEGANDNIRVLVDHAFQVDKAGQINRESLFALRRIEIDDEDWRSAVQALNDSIRVQGSKQYMRFYERDTGEQPWRAITIDLASAAATRQSPEAA